MVPPSNLHPQGPEAGTSTPQALLAAHPACEARLFLPKLAHLPGMASGQPGFLANLVNAELLGSIAPCG